MNNSQSKDLTGLVICGGGSSRMGNDKSLLEYHELPQRIYLFNLLKNFCENVYLSLNENQVLNAEINYPVIKDDPQFGDIGPMKALLSFREIYPESSVIIVGCDYPFIDEVCLRVLIENRNGSATCFLNPDENIYEPMLAIYESSFLNVLYDNYCEKNYSLSRILKHEIVTALKPPSEFTLRNVNTSEEFYSVKELINLKTI